MEQSIFVSNFTSRNACCFTHPCNKASAMSQHTLPIGYLQREMFNNFNYMLIK